MTVSYSDETRRDDLRAAALFVVDDERQEHGFDKRVHGSVGLPDVGRIFEETLAVFPVESEVGEAIRTTDELPCWREVLEKLEPLWKLFPHAATPEALTETEAWSALRAAVQCCVDRHGLWYEEIDYPVTVVGPEQALRFGSWSELQQLDPSMAAVAQVTDALGRPIELRTTPALSVRRVGLPPPVEP